MSIESLFLNVRVIEAKDLPKMDIFGSIDAYACLQLSSSKAVYKTKVIQSYNPRWDQQFHIPISGSTEFLYILIQDLDAGSKNDSVSRVKIPLNNLIPGQVIEQWYELTPLPGVKAGGQIYLKIQIAPDSTVPFQPIVQDENAPAVQVFKKISTMGREAE